MKFTKVVGGKMDNDFYRVKLENVFSVPSIISVYYLEMLENHVFAGEQHNFWEINYADAEKIIVDVEDEEYELKQGELLLIPPNKYHSLRSGSKSSNILVLTFDCDSKDMDCFFKYKQFSLDESMKQIIWTIMKEVRQAFLLDNYLNPKKAAIRISEHSVFGSQQMIKNNIELLLIHLKRTIVDENENKQFIESEDFGDELVVKIIEQMKQNVSTDFNIKDMCQSANYSKSYIYQLFKSVTGFSLKYYYMRLKIEEAKKLVRQRIPNMQISEMLNFSSPSLFCKTFKRYTGLTPRQFYLSVLRK